MRLKWLVLCGPLLLVGLSPSVAGAVCPVTTTTAPVGTAFGCQTVSVAGLSMGDLTVAAVLVALTLGALFMRALIGRS